MTVPEAGEQRPAPVAAETSGPAAIPPVQERGWRRLLVALGAFLFLVPAVPQLRAVAPVTQTLLLLVPALAACAWVAWYRGGRLIHALSWTALAAAVISRPLAGGDQYVALARGWALVLAAAFGLVALLFPTRTFLSRALIGLGITVAAFSFALGIRGVSPLRVERAMGAEISDRVTSSIATLRAQVNSPEWRELGERYPDRAGTLTRMVDGIEAQLRQIAPVGTALFPAFLLFESLAALGLAWSLHHPLSRTRLGPPLAPLREFRFEDQLIWGVIGGLALVLIPRLVALKGVGFNLLLFFGALYALRGLGVLTWFLVFPGRWFGVAMVSLVVIVWPLWTLPLGIGLGDTYFDWRRRARPSNTGSVQ